MTPTPIPACCPQCGAPLPDSGYAGLCPRCVAGSLADSWDVLGENTDAAAAGEAPEVPGWKIAGPLGAGGQGIVWHAVRESDDAPGALKVFRPDNSGGGESRARMEAEAAALRRLTHEGIVQVLDCGEAEDGRFFIATELVEGCDLHRLLQAERLPAERALHIARCVARALEHAHANGIVHRDVKPANVLTGRAGAVKLVDFSLARMAAAALAMSMTRDGTTFGTPYYLAPELMRGAPATAASDLYALGVMLYEMLTGAPPAGRFAKVSEKCSLPREADALVESLLSEQPEQRPASAAEVARRLEHLQRTLTVSAAARTRRQRWKFASAAAGVALLAGAAGYFAPRPQPLPPPPEKLNANGFPNPAAATRTEPFVNSLGMAFLPVPRTAVLFCRHETRMSDWTSYLDGIRAEKDEWLRVYGVNAFTRRGLRTLMPEGWTLAAMDAEDVHDVLGNVPGMDVAACGTGFLQSQRFCAWLTWREQREGRLGPGQYYRLPTDEEWSAAAGLPPESGTMPEERHEALPAGETIYPWGTNTWPPPPGFGNYGGTEARDSNWPAAWQSLNFQNDNYARVAPAGMFGENAHGLVDLWGNLWEWCDTRRNLISNAATLRGGSWVDGGYHNQFRRDFRRFEEPTRRQTDIGFRAVLVK